MKKNLLKIVLLFAVILVLSSCNRGVGCPSDFSIGSVWSTFSHALAHLF